MEVPRAEVSAEALVISELTPTTSVSYTEFEASSERITDAATGALEGLMMLGGIGLIFLAARSKLRAQR